MMNLYIFIAIILVLLSTLVHSNSVHGHQHGNIPSTYQNTNLISTTNNRRTKIMNRISKSTRVNPIRRTTKLNFVSLKRPIIKNQNQIQNQVSIHSPSPKTISSRINRIKARKSRGQHVQTKDTFMVSVMV